MENYKLGGFNCYQENPLKCILSNRNLILVKYKRFITLFVGFKGKLSKSEKYMVD